MPETHRKLAGTHRPVAEGARKVQDVDPNARIEVTVILKAPDLPPTKKMPEPALTHEEFVREYGAPRENIRKVEKTLKSYGLHIDGMGPTGRSLRVSGTAAAMQAAFRAGVAIYWCAGQGDFRGREGDISVPAEIASLVEGVVGLDQRRVALRKAAAAALAHSKAPLRPADLESRYNFPPGDCAGQKVAIAEFGAPQGFGSFLPLAYFPDDVTSFCESEGRPVPTIRTIAVNLTPLTASRVRMLPSDTADEVLSATREVMMDVEIVATLCSGAKISVYYATWDQKGWLDLIEQVTRDRPVSLSISYGLAEDSPEWEPAVLKAINRSLQAAAMMGITICVSSGDDGSGCGLSDDQTHVEFPGSSPFVLSIGGTMLSGAAQKEVVWWQSPGRRMAKRISGATGGGVSAIFARPRWQTVDIRPINAGQRKGRIVPDVAALAGPPFYQLIFKGEPGPNGGTSASAPVWASLVARLNAGLPRVKRQRFLAPLLYQKAAPGVAIGATGCTSIVSGNNASHPKPGKGYEAQEGYDAVTGWGVPDGKQLLALLLF